MEYKILDAILEAHEAEEIAQDCGLSSEEEGAALWFNEIYYESTWRVDKMPKYNQFVKKIEGGNLYYDYGANYYFLVQENNVNESKNMNMKNTIKLTESELKNIITESVKNIISELDWKTYQNARRKANKKGEYDRALKFGNAAQKEFNKAYGEEGVSGDIFLNRVSAESDDYPSHTLMRMYNYDEEGNYSNPYNYDNTKAYGIMDKYDKDGRYKRVKNPSLKRFFNNPRREKAYKNASKEMDNYVMGNYDYTQGKGWHLKDK